jgi:GDPmannose 4,6-dehydratase
VSFEQAEYTADIVGTGTLRLLECVRDHIRSSGKPVRFYQAGSSEMFGASPPPQHEQTPFYPRSPYAVAKVAAFYFCKNYREAYDMFVANGILFNHESERRGETFVTRKITRAAARIKLGLQDKLYLGNLDAKRDWGHSKDYVRAMWLMLQQDEPDDYVVATGVSRSVEELVTCAFDAVSLDWRDHVRSDPSLYRGSAELHDLVGDASKARRVLGWEPEVPFEQLLADMVEADLERLRPQAAASA